MASAKGHKPPLRVQSQGGNHSWGLALHQHKGLEARLKAHRPQAGCQALMPFPAVTLLVLQQVGLHLLHSVLCCLVIQLQQQHLGWGVEQETGFQQIPGTREQQTWDSSQGPQSM